MKSDRDPTDEVDTSFRRKAEQKSLKEKLLLPPEEKKEGSLSMKKKESIKSRRGGSTASVMSMGSSGHLEANDSHNYIPLAD